MAELRPGTVQKFALRYSNFAAICVVKLPPQCVRSSAILNAKVEISQPVEG